jgi:hypothetical protein
MLDVEHMQMTQLTVVPGAIDPRALRDTLGISRERMARLLDISWKTVERVEAAVARDAAPKLPSSAAATERLGQIQRIVELGLTIYTREGFAHFVSTPLATFGGLTALQMIEQGRAVDVLGALATDYEGAST